MNVQDTVHPLPGVRRALLLAQGLVRARGVRSVIEIGSGDGDQLSRTEHSSYYSQWLLTGVPEGLNTERARADFFVYERS